MSLRDYLAAAALQGMLAYPQNLKTNEGDKEILTDDDHAKAAYEFADAMLRVRNAKPVADG